jgi:hypothetical protein
VKLLFSVIVGVAAAHAASLFCPPAVDPAATPVIPAVRNVLLEQSAAKIVFIGDAGGQLYEDQLSADVEADFEQFQLLEQTEPADPFTWDGAIEGDANWGILEPATPATTVAPPLLCQGQCVGGVCTTGGCDLIQQSRALTAGATVPVGAPTCPCGEACACPDCSTACPCQPAAAAATTCPTGSPRVAGADGPLRRVGGDRQPVRRALGAVARLFRPFAALRRARFCCGKR